MEILEPENSLLTTLSKALDEIDPRWKSYSGLLIPGSWPGQDDDRFIARSIQKIMEAKRDKIPFLGICLGLHALVKAEGGKLEQLHEGRRGIQRVNDWMGNRMESHWHKFKAVGDFPAYDVYKTGGIIETMRLKDHSFFVATQWHPEYQSSRGNPHPLLVEFLNVCRKQ